MFHDAVNEGIQIGAGMTSHDAKLIAALDEFMRDECDRIEAQIGRECRDRDMPPVWHKASMLRRALNERQGRHG
jgi:hypothetical protein